MKTTKILILMLVCSLLLTTVGQVSAADEEIDDGEGDVIEYGFEEDIIGKGTTDEKDNIDITKVTYTKTGQEVTLTLEVLGDIENKGDMEGESLEIVSYAITLTTSDEEYLVMYVNEDCQLTIGSSFDSQNVSNYTVEGGVLTIIFDLASEDETFESMQAESSEFDLSSLDLENLDDLEGLEDTTFYYGDAAPDIELEIEVLYPEDGEEVEAREDIEFYGQLFGGLPPYEYEWDFGDESPISNELMPTHSYDDTGTYTVTFTVTDNKNTVETQTFDLVITEASGPPSNGDETSAGSPITVFIIIIAIIAIIGVVAVVIIVRR